MSVRPTACACLPLCGLACFLGASDARAQVDDDADILNASRRVAWIVQVFEHHVARARAPMPHGDPELFRVAGNLSHYEVPGLTLALGGELVDVELEREYVGLLLEWWFRDDDEESDDDLWLYFIAGGMAYGFARPFTIQVGGDIESFEDPVGLQFVDEQYAIGAEQGDWGARVAYFRTRTFVVGEDGRIDRDDPSSDDNRVQLQLDGPLGLGGVLRYDFSRSRFEAAAVSSELNDMAALVWPIASQDPRLPRARIAFRYSDFDTAGDETARSEPRVLSLRVEQSLAWLFGTEYRTVVEVAENSGINLDTRLVGEVGYDFSQDHVQTILAGLTFRLQMWLMQLVLEGGASRFADVGLEAVTGERRAAGYLYRVELAGPWLRMFADDDAPVGSRRPVFRTIARSPHSLNIGYEQRRAWAKDLQYVVEYGEHRQSLVYVELVFGL